MTKIIFETSNMRNNVGILDIRSLFFCGELLCRRFINLLRCIILLMIVISNSAFAKPDCEKYSPFNFYPEPKRYTLGFSLKRSEILKTTEWDRVSEPEMSMSDAVSLATKMVKSVSLPYTLELYSVKFQQFGCNAPNHFYYNLAYHTRDSKNRLLGIYHVIVYQNGTVYLPIEVPIPILGKPSV